MGILAESIQEGTLNLNMKDPEALFFEVRMNRRPYPLIESLISRGPGQLEMVQMCRLDGSPFDVDLGDMKPLHGQFVEVEIDRCDEMGAVLEVWSCCGYAQVSQGPFTCSGHYATHILRISPVL